MGYTGGYHLLEEKLVRGADAVNAHTAADTSRLSTYTVNAVNHLQETPWMVNKFIHDIITSLRLEGEDTTNSSGDVVVHWTDPSDPYKTNPEMQRIDPEKWKGMYRETKQQIKRRKAKIMREYDVTKGKVEGTRRVVEAVNQMVEFPEFYFPHNLDFRLRIYPIPTDLNIQASKMAKGCLSFRRGTALGDEGLYWMRFTLATHWGEDKLHPDARAAFCTEEWFMDMLKEIVADPLENRLWLDADSPFEFLALALEYVTMLSLPYDHRSFVSHMPGNLDGSCNGAQHLSIISRDVVGAKATNCFAIEERQDLYKEVGDKVYDRVRRDAIKGHKEAKEWLPEFEDAKKRRKIVKRSVMTVPYGVTEYGIADFMRKDGHVPDGADNEWESAKYIRDLIWSSIGETLEKGQALQHYISECAIKCAEAGLPLVWDTPAGSKVTQAYRNVITRRVNSFETRFHLLEEPRPDEDEDDFHNRIGMDVDKMASAGPPNVIHSCDAAHLQITTCRMYEAGIRDFAMIHDSFGCPFAHMGLMRDILRQTAVDMYAGNYLQEWRESVERYSGLKMPDPTFELGEYDPTELLESVYFFS